MPGGSSRPPTLVRDRGIPPDRGTQRHPGRSGIAHRGARAHRRGGGLGQDAGAHPSHRVPDPRARGGAGRHPGHHLHEQGRARDGRTGGGSPRRPRRPGHVDPHVPLDVRPAAAARTQPPGPAEQLHDLRRRRHGAADRRHRAGPRPRSQALRAACDRLGDRPRQGSGDRRGAVRADGLELLRGDRREGLRRVRSAQACRRCARLRRPDHGGGASLRGPSRGAPALPGALPLPVGGRVPGHEPSAVPAGEHARGALPQRLRGGGRRPGRLQLARRHHREPPGLRARLSRRHHLPDGAELPLHPEHPGGRQRADRAQRAAQAEEPVDRGRRRRAHDPVPRGQRARGSVLPGRGDRAAPRVRGIPVQGHGGLLPDERAVPRDRGRADAGGDALPRVRRRAVLPAQGDQGRAGVPATRC